VSRYLERDAIKKTIKQLEIAIPWIKYDKAVSDYQHAKDLKTEAKKAYEQVKKMDEPLRKEIEKTKLHSVKYDEKAKALRKSLADKTKVSLFYFPEL
jgi:hypothetical protein